MISRGIIIRWACKKKREGNPVIGETSTGGDVDETSLYQYRLSDRVLRHSEQDGEIGKVVVLCGVVRNEEIAPY